MKNYQYDTSLYKKIIFFEKITNSVELIAKLKNDNLNGAKFFRIVIQAYLDHDPKFMEWYNEQRKILKVPKKRIEKTKQFFDESEQILNDYYLNDEEIENIFDILEKIEDIEY